MKEHKYIDRAMEKLYREVREVMEEAASAFGYDQHSIYILEAGKWPCCEEDVHTTHLSYI